MDFSEAVLLLRNGRRVTRRRLYCGPDQATDAKPYLYVVDDMIARCCVNTRVVDPDHAVTMEDLWAKDWEEFYQGDVPQRLTDAVALLKELVLDKPPLISWNNQAICKFCGSPAETECKHPGCPFGKVLDFLGIKNPASDSNQQATNEDEYEDDDEDEADLVEENKKEDRG